MSVAAHAAEPESWQISGDAAVAYERDFVPAIFGHWPPVMAEILAMAPGDRVLDVACGTGVLAREALARVGPTGRVVGLDLNPAMLAVARRLRPEIDWRQGDAGALPFQDQGFDVVACQMAFMFFPDQRAALAEMWRVLAPDGRLAVLVPAPLREAAGYRRLATILEREAGEPAAAMVEGYFAHGKEEGLLRLAKAAGIKDARVLTREGWARFASIDEALRIEIKGSPLAGLVDEEAYARVAAAARAAWAGLVDDAGGLALRLDGRLLLARKG